MSDPIFHTAAEPQTPATPALQYVIPLPWEERERHLSFAAMHGLGLEVTTFCSGAGLNDARVRAERIAALAQDLRGWAWPLSYHGAFMDISLHSPDAEIAAASRRRIRADLTAAQALGCAKVVFHTGFNPQVSVTRYWREVVEGHSQWWPIALEEFPELTVCLENQYESDPALFREILQRADHPRLRMCLDVAHAHAFSTESQGDWFGAVGRWIAHMHWNDNHGDRDSHLAVGDGTLPWREIWETAGTLQAEPTIVLEMNRIENIKRSLEMLERWGMRSAAILPKVA